MKMTFIKGKVSVIIPCRNEKKFISNCLDSFVNQSYPNNLLEVLVCDGMSTDDTRNIIKSYENRYNFIKLIDNPGLTAPRAMNTGIKYSDAEYVIIFGAHAYADKNFVRCNIEALQHNNIGCAGGIMETINDSNKGKAIALAMSSPFGVGNALFRYAKDEQFVDTVAFGAYKRDVLEHIGYFDEELVRNQDDELNFRVTNSGYKILLSPQIRSTYYSRGTLKKLWKQYFQYGFWKVRVMQKHGRTASLRHLVPMLFVLINIIGVIGSIFNKFILMLWLIELSIYLLGNLTFALRAANKEYKLFGYISLSFIILHLSYGFGFLNGLINFYLLKSNKALEKNTKMSR